VPSHWKISVFPPFLLIATLWHWVFLDGRLQNYFTDRWLQIGKTMVPASIFAIGLRFRLDFESLNSRFFVVGNGLQISIAPRFGMDDLSGGISKFEDELILHVTILESGMAPMITGSSWLFNLTSNPKLGALLSGLGNPGSYVSSFDWIFFAS